MHIIMGHIHQQVSSPHCIENELLVGSTLYVYICCIFSAINCFEFELNWNHLFLVTFSENVFQAVNL